MKLTFVTSLFLTVMAVSAAGNDGKMVRLRPHSDS